jgi:hypothetical protein
MMTVVLVTISTDSPTEHIPQQYPARLASSAACGVMLHVYRDLTPRLSFTRHCDRVGGP